MDHLLHSLEYANDSLAQGWSRKQPACDRSITLQTSQTDNTPSEMPLIMHVPSIQ
eukprot:COSAG01_NODE_1624_length_9704_cov_186.948777_8_plen_55_part_00